MEEYFDQDHDKLSLVYVIWVVESI